MRTGRAAICGVVFALLAGCGLGGPDEAVAPPPTPGESPPIPSFSPSIPRLGPEPSWSVPFQPVDGLGTAVAIGDVVVLEDKTTVRAVRPASGEVVWQRPRARGSTFRTASGAIVFWVPENPRTLNGRVETIDANTGKTLWRSDHVSVRSAVFQDAVYLQTCKGLDGPRLTDCTTARHDIRSGKVQWRIPTSVGRSVSGDAIGARRPTAPVAGRYVAAGVGSSQQPWGAVEAATGRVMPGRVESHLWYTLAVGNALVVTDHDTDSGRCAVRLTAVNIETGSKLWSGSVAGGRRKDGECDQSLTEEAVGMTFLGGGSRIAAATVTGKPQLFDLATGRTVWTGTRRGVPIDGDQQSILVREHADDGGLAVLDLASGRARWTAPDPGMPGTSASWQTAVTDRLVAVSGLPGQVPHVLVYDAGSGRMIARVPGWLAGAGADWVAVSYVGKLELIRF